MEDPRLVPSNEINHLMLYYMDSIKSITDVVNTLHYFSEIVYKNDMIDPEYDYIKSYDELTKRINIDINRLLKIIKNIYDTYIPNDYIDDTYKVL